MLKQVVLTMFKHYFQDINKFQSNQIDCPIVIDLTQFIIPTSNPGLVNIRGIVMEKSDDEPYLYL